jgi:hypothetical protein
MENYFELVLNTLKEESSGSTSLLIVYFIPILICIIGIVITPYYYHHRLVGGLSVLFLIITPIICCLLAVFSFVFGNVFLGIAGIIIGCCIFYYWGKIFVHIENCKRYIADNLRMGDIEYIFGEGFDTIKGCERYFLQRKKDKEAQYWLGIIYYKYMNKKQKGVDFFKKSANQNYQPASDYLKVINK